MIPRNEPQTGDHHLTLPPIPDEMIVLMDRVGEVERRGRELTERLDSINRGVNELAERLDGIDRALNEASPDFKGY